MDPLPIVYAGPDAGFLHALLECGHHTIVAKQSPVWENPAIALSCDVCGEECLLHPLVLLEFDFWRDSQVDEVGGVL